MQAPLPLRMNTRWGKAGHTAAGGTEARSAPPPPPPHNPTPPASQRTPPSPPATAVGHLLHLRQRPSAPQAFSCLIPTRTPQERYSHPVSQARKLTCRDVKPRISKSSGLSWSLNSEMKERPIPRLHLRPVEAEPGSVGSKAAHTSRRKTGLGLGPQWVSFMGDELLSRPREAGLSYQRRCRTSPWSHPPKAGAGTHAASLGKAYTLRHKVRRVPGNLRAKSLTSNSLGRDWPQHHTETHGLRGKEEPAP